MVVQGVQNNVTLFTLSDFSRTFIPASSGAAAGTDHAWANHAFVIGGSVLGGDFYGMNTANGTPYPTLTVGAAGPDDTDSSFGGPRALDTDDLGGPVCLDAGQVVRAAAIRPGDGLPEYRQFRDLRPGLYVLIGRVCGPTVRKGLMLEIIYLR